MANDVLQDLATAGFIVGMLLFLAIPFERKYAAALGAAALLLGASIAYLLGRAPGP